MLSASLRTTSCTLFLAFLILLFTAPYALALDFTWPANTVQCGIVPMNITGGSPPYEFTIVPIDGQVFSWNLIEPVSGKWINESWNVQMPAGTAYVVYLSHSGSFGQGGITPIQVVGSSTDTLCLSTASSNASTNLFSMDLAGLPAPSECDTSLKIKHDGSAASAPYNYTIVPLDGGYKPWSAAFPDGVNELDVSVNMTSGSRFSVFLSRIGYGGAQTGKIYTVNQTRSNSITCETQPYVVPSGYVWPSSLLSTTLPVADDYNASSSVVSSTATGSSPIGSASSTPTGNAGSSESKGLSTGAMAGIGAGVGCLALAGVGVLVWWFLRKRRGGGKAREQRGFESGEKRFDMLSPPKHTDSYGPDKGTSAAADGAEPRVEPFRTHSDYARASLPVQGYAGGQQPPAQGDMYTPGLGSDGGQTDYAASDPMQMQPAHASQVQLFPMPQPSGDRSFAPSESDGLSRGPTGTAFYYIPPSGSMGMASGSAIDIARVSSQASTAQQAGQDSQQALLPPGTMLRGPVSAASEKARLSAQYAQMESSRAGDGSSPDTTPGNMASPSSSLSPFTPPGPNAPVNPIPFGQPYLPHRVDSPGQTAQARVSIVSPASAVESQRGHVQSGMHGTQQHGAHGEEHVAQQSATYRRHMDGGELQDENRPDVGQVDLPPLYEDVPARRS